MSSATSANLIARLLFLPFHLVSASCLLLPQSTHPPPLRRYGLHIVFVTLTASRCPSFTIVWCVLRVVIAFVLSKPELRKVPNQRGCAPSLSWSFSVVELIQFQEGALFLLLPRIPHRSQIKKTMTVFKGLGVAQPITKKVQAINCRLAGKEQQKVCISSPQRTLQFIECIVWKVLRWRREYGSVEWYAATD